MDIGGLQKFTLSDFPGRAAAIIFTQGCNFNCSWCHNRQLIPKCCPGTPRFEAGDVLGFLESRRGRLDGLVITGGEPTIQDGLVPFIRKARKLGFEIKLDSNGSRPGILSMLVEEGLIDYLAIDIKAPEDKYGLLTGKSVPAARIMESVSIASASGIEHEFRTTYVPHLLSCSDMDRIAAMVPSGSRHTVQNYRQPPLTADEAETGAA